MSPQPQRNWTFEEYLAYERESEVKHEFFQGEIFAMAGASWQHNAINTSLTASLHPQVRAHGCHLFANDMRVRIPATTLGAYPDLVVACGDLAFEDEHGDTLTNPTLLLEVLSPSTADYDRGKKFAHYRTLPSLTTYVMVEQNEVLVEVYERQAESRWVFSEYRSLAETLELPTVGARLPLTEIYAAVPEVGGP